MPRRWVVSQEVSPDKFVVLSKERRKNLTCNFRKRTKALHFLSILFAERTRNRGLLKLWPLSFPFVNPDLPQLCSFPNPSWFLRREASVKGTSLILSATLEQQSFLFGLLEGWAFVLSLTGVHFRVSEGKEGKEPLVQTGAQQPLPSRWCCFSRDLIKCEATRYRDGANTA